MSSDAVLDRVERWTRRLATLALAVATAALLRGLWEARSRPKGRAVGVVLPLPVFVAGGLAYAVAGLALWRPLPLRLSPLARGAALALGAALYASGLGLILWGRRALGDVYAVSSALGARLYAGHRLVTHGPYALVRHPMYVGGVLAAVGALLIFRTWTAALAALGALGLVRRARLEEEALAQEFGPVWEAYRRRVPGWVPRRRPWRAAAGAPDGGLPPSRP